VVAVAISAAPAAGRQHLGKRQTPMTAAPTAVLLSNGPIIAGVRREARLCYGKFGQDASAPIGGRGSTRELLATCLLPLVGIKPETIVYNHLTINHRASWSKGAVVTGF